MKNFIFLVDLGLGQVFLVNFIGSIRDCRLFLGFGLCIFYIDRAPRLYSCNCRSERTDPPLRFSSDSGKKHRAEVIKK